MPIAILADEVVDRIAAGEAVERPASVVKELLENAIDAGATSVHIETRVGGRKLLRVSDNGSGIRQAELALAFKRHATSKLQRADDLRAIRTLGFRGEALASIAAVSQCTVLTRHRKESAGLRLRLDGGQLAHREAIGAPAGSVITVENLFFNTPARLKFLKSDNTEKRHIYWVVARYALAYPHIAFALRQDERERFRSSGSGQLADVVARVFGVKEFRSMLAVQNDDSPRPGLLPIDICGYVSAPSLHRASRDRIILFVNGRAVQDSTLAQALIQAYAGLLEAGKYPLAALLLTVPVDFVDVNVHPTKAEVRFRDPQQVFRAVQRAVRRSLLEIAEAQAEDWQAPHAGASDTGTARAEVSWRRSSPDDPFDNYGIEYIPEAADAPNRPRTLPVLRVIGQVGATYIIAEGPAGLYLVDQNAAHERVLYQRLQQALSNGGASSQVVDESQTILLSPQEAQLLEARDALLCAIGFEIEAFGPNTYVVRAQPACLDGVSAADSLPWILSRLRDGDADEQAAVAALAAVAAIKRGQILAADEMQALIAELERCPQPHSAPSGNKTLVHITSQQLAAEFRQG